MVHPSGWLPVVALASLLSLVDPPRVRADDSAATSRTGKTSPAAKPAVPVAAKPALPPAKPPSDPAALPDAPRAVQRFSFDPDDVTGDLQRPDDEVIIGGPRRPKHASLIEIRSSFTGALVRSLEDL